MKSSNDLMYLTPYQWLEKHHKELIEGYRVWQAVPPNSSERSLAQEKIGQAVQGIFRTARDITSQEQAGIKVGAAKQLLAICKSQIKKIEDANPEEEFRWTIDRSVELAISLLIGAGLLYALGKAENYAKGRLNESVKLWCGVPVAKATLVALRYFGKWHTLQAIVKGEPITWMTTIIFPAASMGLFTIFHPIQAASSVKAFFTGSVLKLELRRSIAPHPL